MNKDNESSHRNARSQSRGMTIGRAFLIFLLIIIAIAGVFYLTQYNDVALKPSSETTLITGPLDSKGRVDYLKAFEESNFSKDIASEKNGFRLVIQKVFFFKNISGPHYENVCRKLGLDPETNKPTIEYEDPYGFAAKYNKSGSFDEELVRKIDKSLVDTLGERPEGQPLNDWDVGEILVTPTVQPWNGKKNPVMKKWVEENSAALDLYAKAVRMEQFDIPFSRENDSESIFETAGYHMQELRAVGRGFNSRANYFVGIGEYRKAIDDVVSCKRLGRHISNRNTYVDRLLGIAIEGIADSIGIVNVSDDKLTKEDLDYFSNELKSIPKRSSLEHAVNHEKLAQLDWLQRGAYREADKWMDDNSNARHLREMGLDWNVVMREFNTTFDELWEQKQVTYQPEIELSAMDFLSREARSKKFAQWYTRVNAGVSVRDADHRSTCSERLRSISIAMLCYEKENGTLPPAFTTNKSGDPLHSWRVLLLPYLGEQDLYSRLKLDEPWDSPHNAKFKSDRPDVFACPACDQCKDSKTSYAVVIGKTLPFDESGVGKFLFTFGSDSNDMILVVERSDPVDWMDPNQEISLDDALEGINSSFDGKKTAVPVGSKHANGAQFGLRNTGTYFLAEQVEAKVFEDLLKGKNRKINP